MPKIAIVAGEASGDLLGGHLITALKKARSDLDFFGIAGPKMQREGAKTLYPMEKLSVRELLCPKRKIMRMSITLVSILMSNMMR